MRNLKQLRAHAVSHALYAPRSLGEALRRSGFVQADPIRSPAPAQDLILRHRVADYRVGDLDRAYPSLQLEEGTLYAYGYLPREHWEVLRPAPHSGPLPPLDAEVLDFVRRSGAQYPAELAAHFGRERARNAWGGRSRATQLALERLQRWGLLRVVGRRGGVRGYAAAAPPARVCSPERRAQQLVRLVAWVLAPVLERTLRALCAAACRRMGASSHASAIEQLCSSGELIRHTTAGRSYLWPAGAARPTDVPAGVRFLSPFDPLVWDRERFEHLWGWAYRFEAYTPAAQRVRGYYAMPVLFRDRVIGWANWSTEAGRPRVDVGFVEGVPRGREFRTELEAEAARMKQFLVPREPREPREPRSRTPRGASRRPSADAALRAD